MSKHSSKKKVTPSEIKERNQVRDISDEVRDIYSKIRMGSPKGDVISEQDKQEIERAIAQVSRWGSRRKKPDEKIRAMIRDCFARAPVDSLPKMTYAISNSYRDSSPIYRERKISDEAIKSRMQDYFLKHEVISPEISQNSQNEVVSSKSEDVSVIPNIPEIAKDWHKLKKHLESIVDSVQLFNQACAGIGNGEKTTARTDEKGVHAGKEGYSHQRGVIYPKKPSYLPTQEVIYQKSQSYLPEDEVIYPKSEAYLPDQAVISQSNRVMPPPDKRSKKLLESIVKEPLLATVERYKKIRLNPKFGNRCKQKLIEHGLIIERSTATSKARIKLLELTDKGKEVVKELGIEVSTGSTSLRHGKSEHLYGVMQAKKKLIEAGYIVEEEYPIGNGKSVDLVVVGKDGKLSAKKIAVEIETGKSDAIGNIRKCLEAGFDVVESLATSKEVQRKIEAEVEKLDEDEREKVRVSRI